LFPEGTRSRSGKDELLPFKKGAFHLAISGQFQIVPIVFSTYGSIYNSRLLQFEGGKLKARGNFIYNEW
jgi:lysophosphatidate acyltransferase